MGRKFIIQLESMLAEMVYLAVAGGNKVDQRPLLLWVRLLGAGEWHKLSSAICNLMRLAGRHLGVFYLVPSFKSQ